MIDKFLKLLRYNFSFSEMVLLPFNEMIGVELNSKKSKRERNILMMILKWVFGQKADFYRIPFDES